MKMMSDKRGKERDIGLVIFGIVVLLFAVGCMIYLGFFLKDKIIAGIEKGTQPLGDSIKGIAGVPGPVVEILNVLTYIFGPIPTYLQEVAHDELSALIVYFGIWLLLFITFSDIFATFSSFRKDISWLIGFVIAAIAANLKTAVYLSVMFTTVFAGLGIIGVFLGLGASIVAFVAVNFGITSIGSWVMNRQALVFGAKAEAGGKRLAGGLKGIGELTKALGEEGEKK